MTIVDERPPVRRFRVWPVAALVLVVLVAAAGGWFGYREMVRDRVPFEAAEARAAAVVKFTEWPDLEETARSIGADGVGARPAGDPADRIFVARLEHHTPAVDTEEPLFYHVIVVDEQHSRVASVGNVVSGRPTHLTELAQRYPWVPPAVRGEDTSQGWLMESPVKGPGVISFAGTVRDGKTMTEKDLTVVLLLVAQGGTVHWAERVTT